MTYSKIERSTIEEIAKEFLVGKSLVSKMYDSFKQEFNDLSEEERTGKFIAYAHVFLSNYQKCLRDPFRSMDA